MNCAQFKTNQIHDLNSLTFFLFIRSWLIRARHLNFVAVAQCIKEQ